MAQLAIAIFWVAKNIEESKPHNAVALFNVEARKQEMIRS